ncbi:MAG: DUF3137 domain-containing protein [Butyrivibrio sp.]|nr:DUF3137 domain-containing protein [Butyrivibrio sp.]
MEENNNAEGERELYSAEEIIASRSNEKLKIGGFIFVIFVNMIVIKFTPIRWWIKILIFLLSIGFEWAILEDIKHGIDIAKNKSAEDTVYRALTSLGMDIKKVSYSRIFNRNSYLGFGSEIIYNLGFGFENHAKTSFMNDGTKTLMPRLIIEGTYKGLDYKLIQYKNHALLDEDEKRIKEKWSDAMNFMEVKLPNEFGGYVEIYEKSIPDYRARNAVSIETDDILFNEKYKVISDEQLGAFILLNPRHIVKIQDFAKELAAKSWSTKFVLLFMQGYFYTQNEASTWINVNAPAKKNMNIKKAIKKCSGIEEFIRTYIDCLNLDTDEYTTRKKGT